MADTKTNLESKSAERPTIDLTDVTIIALALIGQTPKGLAAACWRAQVSDTDWKSVCVVLDGPNIKSASTTLTTWPAYAGIIDAGKNWTVEFQIPKSNYLDTIRVMHKDVTAVSHALRAKIAEGAGIAQDKVGVYLAEVERGWKATDEPVPTWKSENKTDGGGDDEEDEGDDEDDEDEGDDEDEFGYEAFVITDVQRIAAQKGLEVAPRTQ